MPSYVPEQVGPRVRRRLERAFASSVGLLTLSGILLPGGAARADVVQDLINYVLLGIAFVLQWIIFFAGKLVVLLVDVIIDVAQYNNFVNAVPVESGWPLVRDVVNMFFIVILLVTAFSTIVQWKKFDYRRVLPKLLLMAVMVNFSKTIVGLLIDFSQVLMLTFVNAFKAAAAGNFVSALKLDKILQLDVGSKFGTKEQAATGGATTPADSPLLQMVLAEFLGLFFLGTTLVMLLIMLVYLIARVVGLWLALIFSPGAFFATALATTPLASKVGLLGDKYWARLGGLLSGGPVMAFFLWLTLATVQQGGMTGFIQPAKSETVQAESFFASEVGKLENVATYFVAIIMLLMGIEAAVSIAREVSETLGAATQRIQSGGMAATRFATYGAAAAGGALAARGARRVAGAGFRAAERRLELRERLGAGLQRVGAATGITGIAAAGAGLRRGRAAERAEAAKGVEAAAAGMAPEQRMRFLERAGRVGGERGREARVMLAREQLAPEGADVMRGRLEAQGKAKGLEGAALTSFAQAGMRDQQGSALSRLEEIANARGDTNLLKQVREQKEKRPDLLPGDAFGAAMTRLIDEKEPDELARTLGAQAYQDTRVSDALLQKMVKPDGTFDEDSEYYKKLIKNAPQHMRGKLLRQRHEQLQGQAATENTNVAQLLASGGAAGGMFTRVGGEYVFQSTAQIDEARARVSGAAPVGEAAAAPVRRESEIKTGKERLDSLRTGGAPAEQTAAVQLDMQRAGARMSEIYQVDQKGTFASDGERKNFELNVSNTLQAAKAGDVQALQNMDVSLLDQNPRARNEARSAFVESAKVDDLSRAWRDTEQAPEARKGVANMARIVHTEGTRAEQLVADHNKKNPEAQVDINAVRTAGAISDPAGRQAALRGALGNSGLDLNLEEAAAVAKKFEIETDITLRNFAKEASRRTTVAAGRATRATGRAAAGAGAAVAGAAAAGARRFTAEGRAAAQERTWERRAGLADIRGAEAPAIAPTRPGGPPRRRPDVPPPGPPPVPPAPQPPATPPAGGAPPAGQT